MEIDGVYIAYTFPDGYELFFLVWNTCGRRIRVTRMKKNIFTAVCLFLLGLGLCGCYGETGEETMEILRGQAPGKEEASAAQ